MHSVPAGKAEKAKHEAGQCEAGLVTESLLEFASRLLPANTDLSRTMVSRLDLETSGLVLFAGNEAAKARFAIAQDAGALEKVYRLRCASSDARMEGALPGRFPAGIDPERRAAGFVLPARIASRFRSFGPRGAMVACVAESDVGLCRKPLAPGLYETIVAGESTLSDGSVEAEVRISRGFRHQIRAHLAWCGWPILGDSLYGGLAAGRLNLEAHALEFPGPDGKSARVELYDPALARMPAVNGSPSGSPESCCHQ